MHMNIRFGFDGDTATFTATAHGPNWNGWLCPIVDADNLKAVITRMAAMSDDRVVGITFSGTGDSGTATITEYELGQHLDTYELRPDAAGNYLLNLGLTLRPCL